MISQLEKEVTLRFLRSRKKDGFLNVISIFSFIGIGLGVAVLIIVMSVMNGFRTELVNKIIGFNSHLTIKPYSKKIDVNKLQNEKILNNLKYSLESNSGEAVILKNDSTKGILLRGYSKLDFEKLEIINNENFNGIKNSLQKDSISIGKELSFSLDLEIGDNVVLMSPFSLDTIIGSLPRQKSFIITSIFDSGLADFDNNVAFINLNSLEEFFNYSSDDRNLELFLKDPQNIENQKEITQRIFEDEYVYSWAYMNSSLFSALKVERNVMFIILSLIIIVAAFNIISGLTILVKNKTKDIGILKSIGVQNKSIVKIFFLVGILIGSFGVLLWIS